MARPVTPEEAIHSLANAVIMRAVEDLFFGHPFKKKAKQNIQAQLAAFQFLTSDECQIWADMAGRDLDTNMIWQSPDSVKQALLAYNPKKLGANHER